MIYLADGNGRRRTSGSKPENGVWFHLAVKYRGWSAVLVVYKDGEIDTVQDTGDNADDYSKPGPEKFVLGRKEVETNDNYASVALDEFLIFSRGLSDAEVMMLTNSYTPP